MQGQGQEAGPGARPMRRARQQLGDEETRAVFERGSYGVLAMVGDGGYPYGVPINYVWLDGHIYVHMATAGHKLDALCADGRVSFTVVDSDRVVPEEYTTYFRSAIAFGRARLVDDPAEKLASLQALGRKYYPGHEPELAKEVAGGIARLHMVRVDIERMTGKEAIELVRARERASKGEAGEGASEGEGETAPQA